MQIQLTTREQYLLFFCSVLAIVFYYEYKLVVCGNSQALTIPHQDAEIKCETNVSSHNVTKLPKIYIDELTHQFLPPSFLNLDSADFTNENISYNGFQNMITIYHKNESQFISTRNYYKLLL